MSLLKVAKHDKYDVGSHFFRPLGRVVVKLDSKGGKFFEWNMFILTSSSGPSMRTKGPSDIDRERIQAFIDGANSLIKDDARREAGGFKLSEPDFKFERIPEGAVSRPLLSQKELKVRLRDSQHASRGALIFISLWRRT